jgi:hypothetical protein
VAPYSPRARPGVPVSFPVAWDSLDEVSPEDFTVRNAARLPGDADPWAAASGVSSHGLLIPRGRLVWSSCSGNVSPYRNLQDVIGTSGRLRDDLDASNFSVLKYAERHSEAAAAYAVRERCTINTPLICRCGAVR